MHGTRGTLNNARNNEFSVWQVHQPASSMTLKLTRELLEKTGVRNTFDRTTAAIDFKLELIVCLHSLIHYLLI